MEWIPVTLDLLCHRGVIIFIKPDFPLSIFRDIMNIMEIIASLNLPTEVILILMHVVVFSGDGLQLDNPSYIQDTQTHYLSLVFRWDISI